MRTTIRIDDGLFAEVRRRAAEKGCSLTAVIEDALRQAFHKRQEAKKGPALSLTVVGGSGLQHGVDLDNSAALSDLMEGR